MLELETEHIQALGFLFFIGLFSHQMMQIDNPKVRWQTKAASIISCIYGIYIIIHCEKISTFKEGEYLPIEWMALASCSALILTSLAILILKKVK